MDICIRKPLVATCSTDRTVRLWNYNDRTCELVKSFTEEIFSIAIHPTGLQVGYPVDAVESFQNHLLNTDVLSCMTLEAAVSCSDVRSH